MLFFGCATDSHDNGALSGPSGSGGSGEPGNTPASLSFAEDGIQIDPGQARTIRVQASPPGIYRVRFTLLGDALDASLSQSDVDTDPEGAAEVILTAPTTAPGTTFTVRAAVNTEVSDLLTVTVNPDGSARVQVEPHYNGHRNVTTWVASIHPGEKCADLSGTLTDGSPAAQTPAAEQPFLANVPVGAPVAVTVRAGHFAVGCTDVTDLKANQVNPVAVDVYDLPLRLDTPFSVELTASSVAPSWRDTLAPVLDLEAVKAAVLGQAQNDAGALLDAMQKLAPVPEPSTTIKAFATARNDGNWDAQLAYPPTPPVGTVYKAVTDTALRTPIERWLGRAPDRIDATASLVARIEPTDPGSARMTPSALAGVSGTDADHGLGSATVAWSADPDDTLLLGARLTWTPAKLLARLAEAEATAETGAPGAALALSLVVDCSSVARMLLAAGAERDRISFGSCDQQCTADLCAGALAALWHTAIDALPATSAVIDISATAKTTADDEARPRSCQGSWRGTVTLQNATPTSVSGGASFSPVSVQ